MKRIVDIFSKDWTSEIVWTYVITLGNEDLSINLDSFENEALRLAIEENRGTENSIFAKVRE